MAFNKCRFCKGVPFFFYSLDRSCKEVVQLSCRRCGNSTRKYHSEDEAFNAWNEENK